MKKQYRPLLSDPKATISDYKRIGKSWLKLFKKWLRKHHLKVLLYTFITSLGVILYLLTRPPQIIIADTWPVDRVSVDVEPIEIKPYKPAEAAKKQTPTPAPPPTQNVPQVASGSVWDSLSQCEAGGVWSINTGNGYSGGLQWHPGTWAGYKAPSDPTYAWQASREQEIAAAERLLAATGGRYSQSWPACSAKLNLP